jgi:cytochrome bd-type quinol oxidase subunit 2
MKQSPFVQSGVIKTVLVLGLIPILLFPPSTYDLKSQEWWLPLILVVLALVGIVQLLRKSSAPWPIYLVAFAQGFNIISRLLMFMPNSTVEVEGAQVVNSTYLIMTVISMVISGIILWYIELPEVKQKLAL